MCYSAMVKQDAKKLGLEFHARVQLDLFDDLFTRRNKGEKIAINKWMERHFLEDAPGAQEEHIADSIVEWRKNQLPALYAELEKQKARLLKARAALESEPTKKSENELRVATNKIEQIGLKIEKIESPDYVTEDEKSVFPFHYVTMIYTSDTGERLVAPFRYHLRPAGKDESFDRKFNGCYNARRDNLTNSFWSPLFGRRHGILVLERFYEYVAVADYKKHFSVSAEDLAKNNLILSFQPKGIDRMIVPTLWDINKQKGQPDLYSCAIITDEPPPEIAETGHNRCPVFLKEENVERWLTPKGRSKEELDAILADKQKAFYIHKLVAA